VVVENGPGVVLQQWLCDSGMRSVRGTGAVAAWFLKGVRAWY
jgi:hypothetical protein